MTTTQEFPPAAVQRERFAQARAVIVSLMDETGLLAQGWTFRWDNGRNRYGACKYGPKQITLSKYLVALNPEEMTEEVARHEVAHALTPLVPVRRNGRIVQYKSQGHGPAWKANARRLGIAGDRCHSGETVQGRYVGTCEGCGAEFNRHKMTQAARRGGQFHTECGPTRGKIAWRER